MPGPHLFSPVSLYLWRAGGILGTFAVILGLISMRLERTSDVGIQAEYVSEGIDQTGVEAPRSPVSQTSIDVLVTGNVRVAVAEVSLLDPDDWRKLLDELAAELRLGLTIEVPLPKTASEEAPPGDCLSRLMWAKRLLRAYRIELKVEQDAIRLQPLNQTPESPLEARDTSGCRGGNVVSPLRTRGNAQITSFSGDVSGTILSWIESPSMQRTQTSAQIQPTRTS